MLASLSQKRKGQFKKSGGDEVIAFMNQKRSRSKESVLQEPFVTSVVTWWHVARTVDVEHAGSIEQHLEQ